MFHYQHHYITSNYITRDKIWLCQTANWTWMRLQSNFVLETAWNACVCPGTRSRRGRALAHGGQQMEPEAEAAAPNPSSCMKGILQPAGPHPERTPPVPAELTHKARGSIRKGRTHTRSHTWSCFVGNWINARPTLPLPGKSSPS